MARDESLTPRRFSFDVVETQSRLPGCVPPATPTATNFLWYLLANVLRIFLFEIGSIHEKSRRRHTRFFAVQVGRSKKGRKTAIVRTLQKCNDKVNNSPHYYNSRKSTVARSAHRVESERIWLNPLPISVHSD